VRWKRQKKRLHTINPEAGTMVKHSGRGRSKFSLIGEFWSYMKIRKKWWLGPIVIVLVLLGLFIVLTEGSALAPLIYTLF